MPPRSQPIDLERLRHYHAQGMTARAIGERTGRSKMAVYTALRAAGLKPNKPSQS
jgi:transposase